MVACLVAVLLAGSGGTLLLGNCAFAADAPKPLRETKPLLAVTDVVLDAARAVRQIKLRCVASETVFGMMKITLLEAVN